MKKARDIEIKGLFRKIDPYISIRLGDQKVKSSVDKNNHNPEWNFKSEFNINKSSPKEIIFEVFDDDIGTDDALGHTSLGVQEVLLYQEIADKWFPPKICKKGEVLLSYEFVPVKETENPQSNEVQLSPVRTHKGVKKIEATQYVKAIPDQSNTEITNVK